MTGHDLPESDQDETPDAVEEQRIRYNPREAPSSGPSRPDTGGTDRIKYNPVKPATKETDR